MFSFFKKIQTQKIPSAGFTLLEMIVAIFIFSIVVTIASGAMLSMISANRKAQALKTVMNNVNLALDSMSRDIRFGASYAPVSGIFSGLCVTTCEGIAVTKPGGVTQYFRSTKNGTLVRKRGALEQELTSTGAVLESLDFVISGTKVLVTLSGYAGKDPNDTQNRFDIQTTMTQRNI
ncbi:MAG: hypothetical protein RLZZ347_472 [Candidatus Parcubacteria bacterium]|jgi:prepilin-type N-terminal cleavage/methylation domain-containing protein